jgi:eukaryotic-like serine/threonine-protein kinase
LPPPPDPQGLARAICETDPLRPSSIVGRVEEVQRADGSVTTVTPESISRVREGDERLLRRRLEGDLDTIVLKAMQKEPGRRYASVDQLSSDLGRHLEGLPVVARKDTLGYRTRKFVGRHKAGVALAVAALLLIVGFSISVTVLWQRALREQQRAQTVSSFLEDLFSVSNPSQSRGETITAREVLDRGVQKIDSSLGADPELRADLMETMGRVYRSLGLYEQAGQLLEKALRLDRRRRDDLVFAQDLHNLSGVLHDMGKDAEAERLIREALAIQRRRGALNIDYAKGLTNLGEILEGEGDFTGAEASFNEALAIKRKLPQVDERDIATSLNNFGKLYETRGDYAAAEPRYRDALKIRMKLAGGRPDPEVATTLNNLATVQQDKGDLVGAEASYRGVLETRLKLLHGPNPNLTTNLNNLGQVLTTEGKAAEAETYLREALAIADKTPGFKAVSKAIFLRNLSAALLSEGKAAEAESKVQEALNIFRANAPTSWRTADAESVLGGCLAAQHRFKEAEPLLKESYPLLQNDKGDGAKRAAEAKQRINDLYKAWGKPEKMMS